MAADLSIDSNCQPDKHELTVKKNEKVNIHNHSNSTCTITFNPGPGPFSQNPIQIPSGNSKEETAANQGSWTYTTQCGTAAKAAQKTAGDGDPIIIVDPPMPQGHGHDKDDHQKKK